METGHHLLIVIADGEHARLVRQAKDNALHTQTVLESATAGARSAELGTDHPGATFHTGATAHHAIEPRHDLHTAAKETFAREVAKEIKTSMDEAEDLRLLLVAPSHTLSSLQDALDPVAKQRVVGTLSKDLVKVPDHQLQPHLRQWVPPIHRTIL